MKPATAKLLRRLWLAYPVGLAEVLAGACIGLFVKGTVWTDDSLQMQPLLSFLGGGAILFLCCLAITKLYLSYHHRRMAEHLQEHWTAQIKQINRDAVAEREPTETDWRDNPDWWKEG
jgi:hypothetical protein